MKNEKAAQGEQYVPVALEVEPITLPPVITEMKKFVICLDTMGQDRQFTTEEKEFVLEAVFKFKKHWENFENDKLIEDRDALINEKNQDTDYFTEEKIASIKEKEDGLVEARLNP